MAAFADENFDRVQYLVSSGQKAPLCRLYFCRHCMKLRSIDCLSHEIDSHFCVSCFENMSPAEAKMKRNKCSTCFDCPSCFHTLSTRATSVASTTPVSPDGTSTQPHITKKVYYLGCGVCRWNTKIAGIPNQSIASGAWVEKENLHSERINNLLSYYQQLAGIEKAEKEQKKYIRRKSFIPFSDKFGLSSPRKRTSLATGLTSLNIKENIKMIEIEPAQASEDVEELPDEIFTIPLNLADVTTLHQRLAAPHFQPEKYCELHPRHKGLVMQRSLRCKECEHNVIKPEYNPCSIKYRIQLVAIYHVPEIRLFANPHLMVGKETQVILTMLNPFDFPLTVTLHEYEDSICQAMVSLPKCELMLPARDETAEFDDGSTTEKEADSKIIAFRKANKLGFFISVTPKAASKGTRIIIAFSLRYNYRNMVATSTHTDPTAFETVSLDQPLYVNLGDIDCSSV